MKLLYDRQQIEIDDELSFRNFTNQSFKDKYPLDKIEGKTIYQSSFYHEKPKARTFDDRMKNVTFLNCNLDNCIIPPGNIVVRCSTQKFRVNPIDKKDYLIDDDDKLVRPLGIKQLSLFRRLINWIKSLCQ